MATTELTSTKKARVLLVDDHSVVRQGLAMLIDDEPDLIVCGGAQSIRETLPLVHQLKPDVVLIDITLPDGNGLDLIKQLHQEYPNLALLALSMHDEAVYAERALRAGAKGYIMKKEVTEKVMSAIRRALAGEMYVSERIASKILKKMVTPGVSSDASPLDTLSDREFEVFRLIAQGVGPTEIAHRLNVSVKTIETHREHIKEKLRLKNGTELTRFALQWAMQHA